MGDKDALHELDLINAKLAETAKKVASPRIDVAGAARAQATISGLELQLGKLSDSQASARVSVDTGGSEEKLGLFQALLSKIGLTNATARVSLDDGDLKEKAAADEAALAGLGMGFSRIPLLVGGAMMALPALPGVLAAGAGAAGVAAIAFGGVAKALQDSTKASTAATGTQGKNSAQLAATEQANAAAIENAQRAISDARTQAAHDAITSSENIAQAEQSLRQAEQSEQQAQEALTQARQDAIRTLQQLNNSAADATLQAKQAQLDLEQATLNQQQVDKSATSTALEKEQAALSVAEAQQRLKEAQQGATNATQDANKANKEGVSGLPAVVQAQQQAAAAAQGVKNAQQQLADASRQASWTQQKDAEAISTAVQNLANTQRQQGLAAAASAATGSAAVNQFAQDMAGLSPAAQRVVKDLLGLKTTVHGLAGAAQSGLLPGVDVFIKGLQGLLPALKPQIAGISGLLGSAFAGIGKGISSSGGKSVIKTLLDEGIQFGKIMLPAVGGVASAFGKLGAAGGPAVTGLAKGLSSILAGVGHLLGGLQPAIKPVGQLFQSIGKIIGSLGTPLGALVSLFAQALAPAVQKLVGPIGTLAGGLTKVLKAIPPDLLGNLIAGFLGIAAAVKIWAIAQGILNTILDANPFVLIATAVVALAVIVIKYHKQIFDAISVAWNAIKEFFGKIWGDIVGLAKQWWPLLLGPAGLIIKYHNDIWKFIQGIWNTIAGFFKGVWNGILGTAKTVWGNVASFFKGFWNSEVTGFKVIVSNVAKIFSDCWNGIENTAKTVWGKITGFFSGLKGTLVSAFNSAVGGVKTAWNKIDDVFKGPVNFLIKTVYMGGIRRLWDDVMNAIGLSSLDLPSVPGLAAGGKLPGYGGGDQHLRLLESGEAVVDKDRTRRYAPLLAAMGVPGMASGGIVGDAVDVGKMVLAASTGNQVAFVNAFKDFLPHSGGAGNLAAMMATMPVAMIKHIVSGLWDKVTGAAVSSSSSGGGGGGSSSGGPGGGSSGANAALAKKLYPAWASGQLWSAWNTLEMHEAGWNNLAMNPSSGAFGIAQALGHGVSGGGGKYGNQYGGYGLSLAGDRNANNGQPNAQITWMHNYIRAAYGDPIRAWAQYYAHPGGIGYYANGGATSAGWASVGEHGRELVKLPGGAHVYPHGASAQMAAGGTAPSALVQLEISGGQSAFDQFMLTWLKNQARIKGGGSVQKAFGFGNG